MTLQYGAASDIGLVREVNEDSKLHEPPLFAVADGMGGHSAGDIASAIAISVLTNSQVKDQESLEEAVQKANGMIYQRAASDSKLSGMGTTITAIYAEESAVLIAHVGDCRAYLLRDGHLKRLTRDHTVVGRMVDEGKLNADDADRHPQRNYLERALGIEAHVEVDVTDLIPETGDRILLCSDGLFGMIDDDQIHQILSGEKEPQKASQMLCREAVGAGGRDNVTAIVVDYLSAEGGGEAKSGLRSDPASPGSANEDRARSPVTAKPGRSRKIVWLLAGILAIAAFAWAATAAIQNSWYVGSRQGKVAIFKGLPGSFAGLKSSRVADDSDLKIAALPELYQDRLKEGIKAESLSDARSIVRDLKRLARPEPAPSPTAPSPSPTAPAPPPPAALGSTGSLGFHTA